MTDNVYTFSHSQTQQFHVNLDVFEGPIDLLLSLAREHKIDIKEVSIAELARQYIIFIEKAKKLKVTIAMEYLIMASWLTWLKSRLLLPQMEDEDDEENPENYARLLAWRLKKMEAIQNISLTLIKTQKLNKSIFARKFTEDNSTEKSLNLDVSLTDLLRAYKNKKYMLESKKIVIKKRQYVDFQLAFSFMQENLKNNKKWISIDSACQKMHVKNVMKNSAKASLFATALLMAHEGHIAIKQEKPFETLYLKTA